MVVPAARSEHQYQSIEECEAVLQRMASVVAPANADLMELAAVLAEMGEEAESENSPDAQRRRAEAGLRKAEARYRALVEQIPAVSFMAPLDGTVTELYVSPQIEQLLGFTAEEWLSNPILWYSQLHPDDQERWQESFARTLNTGEHFKSDYRFIARDGRIVWVHGEARVVSDDEGRPLFLQGVAFDITESKTAEEKLRVVNVSLAKARDQALEASRAKSAFLANMSHELRTPLNAIVGFTEMLQEDAQDGGHNQFLPDLQQIHSAAKHLLGMIGGILDLSKIEAGKMDLFLEPFNLADLISDVVQSALPLVEENGNCLEVECPDEAGSVFADLTKVRQVLYNLLSNAAKFTTNGTITLRVIRTASPQGDQIRVDVNDTGIGMTPDQMSGLFQNFSQADVSTTRKYGGTGLGLVISKRFSRMMGGDIHVLSELNKGSTFSLVMPARVERRDDVEEPADESTSPSRPGAQGDAILVIDDDAQVRDLMTRFLTKEGWQVVAAATAAEGLTLARELNPAAITLDAALTDDGAWSVLTAIKGDPTLTHIPVILVTLTDGTESGYTLGASDYLTKPIDWGRLSTLLGKYRGSKSTGRVLVIDDDPVNRELLTRMAAREGWTVSEAANGRVALQQVIDTPPDLILLDLMMPEMDGFEVVRLLRKTQAGRSIPVVVVTAKDLTDEDRRVLSGSVERIMQKGSFQKEELLQELRSLVTAAIPHGKAQPPVAVPSDLHRELERVRSERDAALAQARSANPDWEQEKVELLVRQEELVAEADAVRRQIREQQHTIELLQTEDADDVEQLRAEIVRLKTDRTRSHTPFEPATPQIAEATAQQRKLTCELEELRLANEELRNELARAKEEPATSTVRRKKKKPRATVNSDTPMPNATSADLWYIVYRDEEGQTHKMTASTAGVRMWFQKGLLGDPTQTLASRTNGGPFNPLSSYSEFRDLLSTVDEAAIPFPEPAGEQAVATATATRLATRKLAAPEAEDNRDSISLMTLLVPVVVAILTAVLAAQFLLK